MHSREIVSKLTFVLMLLLLVSFVPACAGGGGGGGGGGTGGGTLPEEEAFLSSGHADATAEAFNHWDEDVPPEVPVECAKCHNTAGFLDFLGIAGPTVRMVDNPVSIDPDADNAHTCDICHNAETFLWDTVVFPSGATITFETLSRWVFCMECHQGRESTLSVDAAITDAAPATDDTVDGDLEFINIHYFAAAATRYGGQAMGGYQYVDKTYDIFFAHVDGVNNCIACHDNHSLELRLATCAGCHTNVVDESDVEDIRMFGSVKDYDGDGNTAEGISNELVTLRALILTAIQHYATDVAGTDIVYSGDSYPYFGIDTNGNGIADPGEVSFGNRYASWTARLLRAAYNLQYSLKDPGCSAHNAKYVIELLYDSIEDLNTALALARQVDLTDANRIDAGHFAGSEEPFRHWDEDGEVEADCSRCHSAKGLPLYVATGTTQAQPLPNGFQCENCHPAIPNFDVQLTVPDITFPSGLVVDSGDNTTNLCAQCHQGRESTVSVNQAIADAAPATDDTVDGDLAFINIHYFAAAATRYGTEAKGGYEYAGNTYNGYFPHTAERDQCIECHTTHGQEVRVEVCGDCHAGVVTVDDIQNIRFISPNDYNGNGNVVEGIAFEIIGLRDILYETMQAYATANPGTANIIYDGDTYPYFFIDTNGNGDVDPGENIFPNGYNTWTARLLRAAYNLQYSLKDTGCSVHNAKYIIQLLYDSIEDLDPAAAVGLTRDDA